MKILWITNSPFPEVYDDLNIAAPVTVGWVNSAAKELMHYFPEISLGVASFYQGLNYKKIEKHNVTHFLLPGTLKNKPEARELKGFWEAIEREFQPEVVHIHGTEYEHSYSYVETMGAAKVVVSVQGLVSIYERYYFGGIDKFDLRKSITLRDVVRLDTIFSQQKNMYQRGKYEKTLISNIKHIIGRTTWDRDHSWAINPGIIYHFCNETLRSSFYKEKWSIDNCERHSIFISQAHYPIKGFHQIIKALPIVMEHYPDAKVYVAGNDFFSRKGVRIGGYGNYVNKLIKKHKLSDHITFTGLLSEQEMCNRFLRSHVFVCPSAIENSPNSVGEAQLLGVPCISAVTGGTGDMISHGETGLLYRFEETEMLAARICDFFLDSDLCGKISDNSRVIAEKRHDRKGNAERLHEIYKTIIVN